MSRISADFVPAPTRVWHRFESPAQDMQALSDMLVPMDDAGEDLSAAVDFDMEPSDCLLGLAAVTKEGART